MVYSEFNIAAVIAAKLEEKRLFTTASLPTRSIYASSPKYAKGTNRILHELGLPTVTSSLDLFSLADKRFIPSCYELEPFKDKNTIFCGSWKQRKMVSGNKKNKILVYMGNGTIAQNKMIKVISSAFHNSPFEVYIAGSGLQKSDINNIHMDSYFCFDELLATAVLFINHGGQNSVIDGLIYGVPQLICPGKVFERKFNASSVVTNKAGLAVSYKEFNAQTINKYANMIISDSIYKENAERLGDILTRLGGVENVIKML